MKNLSYLLIIVVLLSLGFLTTDFVDYYQVKLATVQDSESFDKDSEVEPGSDNFIPEVPNVESDSSDVALEPEEKVFISPLIPPRDTPFEMSLEEVDERSFNPDDFEKGNSLDEFLSLNNLDICPEITDEYLVDKSRVSIVDLVGQGSGFCVGDTLGYYIFATADHVVGESIGFFSICADFDRFSAGDYASDFILIESDFVVSDSFCDASVFAVPKNEFDVGFQNSIEVRTFVESVPENSTDQVYYSTHKDFFSRFKAQYGYIHNSYEMWVSFSNGEMFFSSTSGLMARPGDSGSPVYTMDRKHVVGVASGSDMSCTLFVSPAESYLPLLKELKSRL